MYLFIFLKLQKNKVTLSLLLKKDNQYLNDINIYSILLFLAIFNY